MATKQFLASECSNLLSLRNLLKRDPPAYKAEFLQQIAHFESLVSVQGVDVGVFDDGEAAAVDAEANASAARAQTQHDRHFAEIVEFVAHCLPCFRDDRDAAPLVASVPEALCHILRTRAAQVSPLLRKALVHGLTLLRNRGIQSSIALLPILFNLFAIPDKALRAFLFADLASNLTKCESVGGSVARVHRAFVYELIGSKASANATDGDASELKCVKALGIAVDLFRKNVWKDDKTANIIAEAAFSTRPKVSTGALRFLLCDAFIDDADEESSARVNAQIRDAVKAIRENSCGAKVGSKKSKREHAMERAKLKLKKAEGRSSLGPKIELGPISMLYDAQSFAERLFSKLRASKDAFAIRQLHMNVISRLVSEHQLFLLNLYPFLQRYVQSTQKNVTGILSFLVQSCHSKIPPDVLEPVVKSIADQFVTDRSSPEVMAVGLNAIRSICARQPLCIDATLLQDLVQYRQHRDKGVIMAARGLLALYREHNPAMLAKKDRGRPTDEVRHDPLDYGETLVATDVPGLEMLRAEQQEGEAADDAADWVTDEDVAMSDASDESEPDNSEFDDDAPELVGEEEAKELRATIEAGRRLQEQSLRPLGSVGILTPKDFERLEVLQRKEESAGLRRRRRTSEEGFTVNPLELEAVTKQKKRRLEERIEQMKANQTERKEQQGNTSQKGGNSATNEEKKRLKPFMLTKHSRLLRDRRMDSQQTKAKRFGSHLAKKRKSQSNSHKRKHRRH